MCYERLRFFLQSYLIVLRTSYPCSGIKVVYPNLGAKAKKAFLSYRLLFAFMHLTAGILSLMLTALPEAFAKHISKEPTMEPGFHRSKDLLYLVVKASR